MKLDKFEYISYQGLPNQWKLEEWQLNQINLIVGKNASGKSRIVRGIYLLSELLTGRANLTPDKIRDIMLIKHEFNLYFDIDSLEKKTEYSLRIENGLVVKEKLIIGSKTYLEREESGEGEIWAKDLRQDIRFQTPQTDLAVVKRRDTIQHPFLEAIYQWSNSLKFYEFGTKLGQDTLMNLPQKVELSQLKKVTDFNDYKQVVNIFCIGKEEIGKPFISAIINDMKAIGYNLSEIGTQTPSIIISNSLQYLYVQEDDLKLPTEQALISQGMFRVLSLLIQINYSLLSGKPSCIIIDDIGEGLDYQRSSAIIKLLIEKAKTGLVQLIMTTNDEFIMNGVPLEYWSVIERKSGKVKLHNIFNSREKFKEFEFIGLNNFDFFTSEFALQKLNEEE